MTTIKLIIHCHPSHVLLQIFSVCYVQKSEFNWAQTPRIEYYTQRYIASHNEKPYFFSLSVWIAWLGTHVVLPLLSSFCQAMPYFSVCKCVYYIPMEIIQIKYKTYNTTHTMSSKTTIKPFRLYFPQGILTSTFSKMWSSTIYTLCFPKERAQTRCSNDSNLFFFWIIIPIFTAF